MHRQGVSAWDTLPTLYPDAALLDWRSSDGAASAEVRCRLRVQLYEEVFAMVECGGPVADLGWRLVLLADEHERRWMRWCRVPSRGGPGRAGDQSPASSRAILALFIVGGVSGLLAFVTLMAHIGPTTLLEILVGCGLAMVLASIVMVYFAGRAGLRRSMLRHECPTCGHGLVGIPSSIAPELVKGAVVGPRLCPECATLWPLVPPGDFPEQM